MIFNESSKPVPLICGNLEKASSDVIINEGIFIDTSDFLVLLCHAEITDLIKFGDDKTILKGWTYQPQVVQFRLKKSDNDGLTKFLLNWVLTEPFNEYLTTPFKGTIKLRQQPSLFSLLADNALAPSQKARLADEIIKVEPIEKLTLIDANMIDAVKAAKASNGGNGGKYQSQSALEVASDRILAIKALIPQLEPANDLVELAQAMNKLGVTMGDSDFALMLKLLQFLLLK